MDMNMNIIVIRIVINLCHIQYSKLREFENHIYLLISGR